MVHTLLIDLDGALVDSRFASKTLFDQLAEKYLGDSNLGDKLRKSFRDKCNEAFHTLPHTDYLNAIAGGWDDMFFTDFSGDDPRLGDIKAVAEGYKRLVLEAIFQEFSIADRSLMDAMIAFIYENWLKYYHPYPDAYAMLDACGGCKKYIVTNGSTDIQMKKIRHCGLHDMVDGVFVSGMFGVGKPSAAFFENVLRGTGADKDSTIMIGNGTSDIFGAANAGIRSIWKREPVNPTDERRMKPVAVIDNLLEIFPILRTI